MSLAITSLGGAQSTTDGTTFPVAPSFDVTAGVPVILAILNTKGSATDTPTVADDAGNTYTLVRTRGWGTAAVPLRRWTVFRMDPVSTATVTLTVSFGGNTQTGFWWNAVECAGAKTGADLVVQSIGDTNDATATDFDGHFDPPLAAFADATNNATLAFIGWAANDAGTKDAAMTLLRSGNFNTPPTGGLSQYAIGEVLQPTASWTGTAAAGGIALEIAAETSSTPSASDSATLAEKTPVQVALTGPKDSGSGSEGTPGIALGLTDSAALAETVSLDTGSTSKDGSDTATFSEGGSTIRIDEDGPDGVLSDTAALVATVTSTDAAGFEYGGEDDDGLDLQAVAATPDSGSLAEAVALLIASAVADDATLAEAGTAAVTIAYRGSLAGQAAFLPRLAAAAATLPRASATASFTPA
jgi:hypothetical protein